MSLKAKELFLLEFKVQIKSPILHIILVILGFILFLNCTEMPIGPSEAPEIHISGYAYELIDGFKFPIENVIIILSNTESIYKTDSHGKFDFEIILSGISVELKFQHFIYQDYLDTLYTPLIQSYSFFNLERILLRKSILLNVIVLNSENANEKIEGAYIEFDCVESTFLTNADGEVSISNFPFYKESRISVRKHGFETFIKDFHADIDPEFKLNILLNPSKTIISGSITDASNGIFISSVNVVLSDFPNSDVSNEFGQYQLRNVPVNKNYIISYIKEGYKRLDKEITTTLTPMVVNVSLNPAGKS